MDEYSQGIMADGPVILKNGQPLTPEQIVSELNRFESLLTQTIGAIRSVNRSKQRVTLNYIGVTRSTIEQMYRDNSISFI